MARNGHIKDLNMDPVTRIAGALAVHVTADLDKGAYLDSHSQATLFRGYEVILDGARPPRRDLRVLARLRRLRRSARALRGVRHRAGDGHHAAAAGHRRAQHDRGRGDGLRQPAAPLPAGRPGLLRVGHQVVQPRAVAEGRAAGRARASTSTASRPWPT
ncbi:MAG: hypothetical protein WKF73_17170 [Nocardioidaceae bacterium]